MICDWQIKDRDFSTAIKPIISKINAVRSQIMGGIEVEEIDYMGFANLSDDVIEGWYYILTDICDELEIINKCLYDE